MTGGFLVANAVLIGTQSALVALPGKGIPKPLERIGGRAWSLVPPLSIGIVVAAVALVPAVADGLTWLSLIAIPPLAAAALGWAAHGARPRLALLALPLLAVAVLAGGSLAGDACAAALTALSAITLGRLLAGGVPGLATQARHRRDGRRGRGARVQQPAPAAQRGHQRRLRRSQRVPLPQLQFIDIHRRKRKRRQGGRSRFEVIAIARSGSRPRSDGGAERSRARSLASMSRSPHDGR